MAGDCAYPAGAEVTAQRYCAAASGVAPHTPDPPPTLSGSMAEAVSVTAVAGEVTGGRATPPVSMAVTVGTLAPQAETVTLVVYCWTAGMFCAVLERPL